MATVHMSMAQSVKAHVEPKESVAAFDIGLLSWQSGCRVVDLGGLTGREMVEAMYDERVGEVLRKNRVPFVILPEMWENDPNSTRFADRLGISTQNLKQLERRSLDRRYWEHLVATKVAYPVLTLYRFTPVMR
jgi:hypothetical protein